MGVANATPTLYNICKRGKRIPHNPEKPMMIATAFTDLCSNELWEEVLWLQEQPSTPANRRQIREMWAELERREQRRQYLEDNFAWG